MDQFGKLFSELRRRNVFRVAILYLVASWLILQVADVGASLLGLPTTAGRLIFLFLAIGFPIVLLFSWVYEITPDGIRKEQDTSRSVAKSQLTARKLDTAVIILLVLAIGLMLADRLDSGDSIVETTPVSDQIGGEVTEAEKSIAVLPFLDMSATQDQQYFTDGLSEELLNLLARVDGLSVASRTSSFAYRDGAVGIRDIARSLGVAHILEGSMRKDGDRIRITAQLIETETDRHLWTENYNREFKDIFAIQDEIANAIVDALTGHLGVDGDRVVTVVETTNNVDAYEMYLTARELFIRRENLTESIRLFHDAIKLDPKFARAWEGLAAVEAIADDWNQGAKEDGIYHSPLSVDAAANALAIDPELSMPHAVLGQYASRVENNLINAIDHYNAALEKNAQNSSAMLWKGTTLKYAGYLEEARVTLEKCLTVDPAYRNCHSFLAETYLFMGDLQKALSIHDYPGLQNGSGAGPSFVSIYVRNGQRERAIAIASRKLTGPEEIAEEWIRAIENPERDNSAGLRRLKIWARESRNNMEMPPQLLFSFKAWDDMLLIGEMQRRMLWHEDAKEFRSTPQFKQIVRDRGFLALWLARGFPPQCRAVGADDFECD